MPPPFSRGLWAGPALALGGILALAVVLLRLGVETSPLAWWIANSALRPERILPLLGLGIAFGLATPRQRMAGALAFAAGIGTGFAFYEPLLAPLWAIPNAAESAFLMGPIAALAAGATLLASTRLRAFVLPPLALVAGAETALAIVATDPSLRDASNRIAGVLIAVWLLASTALTLAAFRRDWFKAASRVLGSSLLAIALLYGAAALSAGKTPNSRSGLPPTPRVHAELEAHQVS